MGGAVYAVAVYKKASTVPTRYMSIIWVAVKFIPYNFIFCYYIENVHNLNLMSCDLIRF